MPANQDIRHRDHHGKPRQRTRARPDRSATRRSRDVEGLYDAHGAALFSLACILLADRAEAEGVVEHVLVEAAERHPTGVRDDHRRHLARCLYLRCTRARLGDQRDPVDLPSRRRRRTAPAGSPTLAKLSELSEQQRATIALSLYGAHDYTQVADLMSLPAPVVADLLRSGLHRLSSTPRAG